MIMPEMGGIQDDFIGQDGCFTLWHCKYQYVVFFENDCAFLKVPCYVLTDIKRQRTMALKGTSIRATAFE